jgi:4-hydroxybenzoate polyprenyltransferase
MKKKTSFLDYVFLLRPILFYPVWTFFLAGFWNGSRISGMGSLFAMVFCASALTLLLGAVYILNQIQDRKTDKANGKLFLLANGIIPIETAVWEAVLLAVIAISSALFFNTRFGFLLVLIFILTGYLYNYPPFLWKDKPIMGLATNVLGGILIYSSGWYSGGGQGRWPVEALAYACAVAAAYFSTTLPDMKGDAKNGKLTFPVRYGIPKTVAWSLAFETCSLVLSLLFRQWLLFFPALLGFPFFIRAAIKKTVSESVRATKISISSLAISVCVVYPVYLLPIVGVFFLSKWYYKKRFGFDYPNLRNP